MRRLLFLLLFLTSALCAQRPDITIVCIIDQLAEHHLSRHRHFLTGGLKHLFDHGREYRNAYYPHAQPATATGHAALSTGTYASQHGLIANDLPTGKVCDDPNIEQAGTFAPHGKLIKGKSARNLTAPTLSTSCINDDEPMTSIALSLKSRAAIPVAGPYGTAIWFDSSYGQFTSSKAFGSRLPAWVRAMNKQLHKTLHRQTHTQWSSLFEPTSSAYQFVSNTSYKHTGYNFSLVDTPQPFARGRKPYFLFQQTPQANQAQLQLARLALRMQRKQNPDRPIILWLSLSALDYVGHYYGVYTKEAVDMLFHIDHQLGVFLNHVEKEFGKENCLWALTSDHGILPIPEHLQEKGRFQAQRLDSTALQKDLNRAIYKQFNVKNLITSIMGPQIYINHDKLRSLIAEYQTAVVPFVKNYLEGMTGIKRAWHRSDFAARDFTAEYGANSRERWVAKQYHPERSGDFVVMLNEFTLLTDYPTGTSHDSPYDYDTRVPLFLYGPGRIEPGQVLLRSSLLHLPTTLARLLEVNRPALAPVIGLPGLGTSPH